MLPDSFNKICVNEFLLLEYVFVEKREKLKVFFNDNVSPPC